MSILSLKDVSYTYGTGTPFVHNALKNISLDINKGEIVGIIGHTGSGKSTLVQLLNGLLKPDSGEIFLDGKNINKDFKKISEVRFKVGLVFQYPEYQLFEETVFKDISFGPKNMGCSEEDIKKFVYEAVDLVGLKEELLEKSPFDLSGGEKRRVAIAGVIAMKPEILVLDEPTAGLDPIGREHILNMVKEVRDKTGTTVIIVSHSMEDMAKTAEKILVMSNGEAAMFDNVDNVFSQYGKLVSIGLDIPEITKIAIGLRNKGLKISESIYTVDSLSKEIVELLSQGGTL